MRSKFIKQLILIFYFFFSLGCFAQNAPTYTAYAVKVEKKAARTIRLTNNTKAGDFHTNLTNALAREQINFAGKYILVQWGCGTNCIQAALIDALSGEVYFPEILQGVTQGYNEAFARHEILEFKKGSKLLILYGAAGNDFKSESNDFVQGISYYEWTGKDFNLIKFITH